jgi:hypothetical protein
MIRPSAFESAVVANVIVFAGFVGTTNASSIVVVLVGMSRLAQEPSG